MERIEYSTIDRSQWVGGPWDSEPDKVQWPDEATGLPCLAVRHLRSGHWCGYVGITEGHPAFGKSYNDVDAEVHGGLTYADLCRPHGDEHSKGVCHIPAEGEPDKVWWLGFDCAHSGDYSPEDAKRENEHDGGIWKISPDDRYRTLGYVQSQCAKLARQLAP